MKRTLYVLRHEILSTVMRRSFLLTAFGVPLVSALIFAAVSFFNRSATDGIVSMVNSSGAASQIKTEGYVDESGLIKVIPPAVPEGALKSFPDVPAAREALKRGEIDAYYLIPADYLQSGELVIVRSDFNPFSAFAESNLIRQTLDVNLLDGDFRLARRIEDPLSLETRVKQPEVTREQSDPVTFFLPYGVGMVYYVIILMSASLLLNSITKEKENRVLEILMSAITSRQLFAGKVIGLGLAGLLQAVLWVGTGYLILQVSGQTLDLPADFQLPASFLAWGLLFFLLGYSLYASIMAAVGALVPNLREATQATFVIILPLLVPLMAVSLLVSEPNGTLALALSLFPFTAPVAMMARLAATQVPWWQLVVAAFLLLGSVIWFVRLAAHLFRAQVLLSGQPFDLRRLFRALIGEME
jgi:ABC-2 type transport system permease protein